MPLKKISRICWNSEGWRKPSGPSGKSKNPKAYEHQSGFGHEEWLMDTTKLIDGWHYTFLQPVGKSRQRFEGQTLDVHLYSINAKTKEYWWVGSIEDIHVVTLEDSVYAYEEYKCRGWLHEMAEQISVVRGDSDAFLNMDPTAFSTVKFRPSNMTVLDEPRLFSHRDESVPAKYYKFLDYYRDPRFIDSKSEFVFVSGHNAEKKTNTKGYYQIRDTDIDLVHNRIQNDVYNYLADIHGKKNVGTEVGDRNRVDVVVQLGSKKFVFYEIKTHFSVMACIREAVGQLLEYEFSAQPSIIQKLVIVSPNKITSDAQEYLGRLREKYSIPIYHQQYSGVTRGLEEQIF